MAKLGRLLKVADKYEVESLEKECLRLMIEMLDSSSVLQALSIGHDIGHNILKRKALAYATRDRETLREIVELPEFDEMSPDITKELLISSCGVRKTGDQKEFADGSDWDRLS